MCVKRTEETYPGRPNVGGISVRNANGALRLERDALLTFKRLRRIKRKKKAHAMIEVYLFLAKMVSEWRGFLNPKSSEKK